MGADPSLRRLLHRATIAALAAGVLMTSAAGAGDVSITWTAPGDDGYTGQSSAYEIRYSENPVSGDTLSWWSAATPVGSPPAPRPAGQRESFLVNGLRPNATYYFVLRTSDEVPNVSGFSNVAVKVVPGSPGLVTPTQFVAAAIPGAVRLSWNPIQPTIETGYRLYRKGSGDPSPSVLATLPLSAAAWTDSTIAGGETYEYLLASFSGDSLEGTPAVVQISIASDQLLTSTQGIHGYPNPARDRVTFRVNLSEAASSGPTRITIFDTVGRTITLLVDRVLQPGEHAFDWTCRSDDGDRLAPGVYNVIVDGPSGRSVTALAIIP